MEGSAAPATWQPCAAVWRRRLMSKASAAMKLRRLAWRLGRRVYTYARGDVRNDPRINGEYWLLNNVIKQSSEPICLIDIGANEGNWTLQASRVAGTGARIAVHAFEPCATTREVLKARCAGLPWVTIHEQGMSAICEIRPFYSGGGGSGTNSLHALSGAKEELVELTTCDEFLRESRIAHVSMLKVDTEGFDFLVLRGAVGSLAKGNIDIVQFEYNWRWLLNHVCLRDVFDLVKEKPYRLGKLVGGSIEFYDEWHFEMDRFFENNYVLVKRGSVFEALGTLAFFDHANVAILKRS